MSLSVKQLIEIRTLLRILRHNSSARDRHEIDSAIGTLRAETKLVRAVDKLLEPKQNPDNEITCPNAIEDIFKELGIVIKK